MGARRGRAGTGGRGSAVIGSEVEGDGATGCQGSFEIEVEGMIGHGSYFVGSGGELAAWNRHIEVGFGGGDDLVVEGFVLPGNPVVVFLNRVLDAHG